MSTANLHENLASMKVPVSSLLSPPEPKQFDSFAFTEPSASRISPSRDGAGDFITQRRHSQFAEKMNKSRLPLSPPVSPHAASHREHNHVSRNHSERDPQLFRLDDGGNALSADIPLFPTETVESTVKDIIDRHVAGREMSEKPLVSPTREEYFLAVSCVAKGYNQNPAAWLRREREWLNSHYGKPNRINKPVMSVSRKIAPASTGGLRKSKPSSSVIARVPRVKRTPKAKVYDSLDHYESLSPKAPRQPTNRDDVDYHSLPDFSPPLSTLPKGNNKVLKADWKGQMLDLSADPDRHLLHEAEITLAATLRLSCATYICSKRRIFQARIEALRIGKEFRKTDAQQACKIDVNKASKLWSAYDRVGWLKKELFMQYLWSKPRVPEPNYAGTG